MQKNRRLIVPLSLIILLVVLIWTNMGFAQSSANYTIKLDVISGGGGEGSSINYDLSSVLGQSSAVGASQSGNYRNEGGFFPGEGPSPVDPDAGTIGTVITISGSGFGTAKGKVMIDIVALKVSSWSPDSIQCQLAKALLPGTYDVKIQPKGVGSIILPKAFTVRAPAIDSVAPGSGTSGGPTPIAINGTFFGTKKGKVYLEYSDGGVVMSKSCKVLSWPTDSISGTGMGVIKFLIPKGLPSGTDCVLRVVNPVGSGTAAFKLSAVETDETNNVTADGPGWMLSYEGPGKIDW